MLSNTARCLLLYLLVTTLGVTCQTQGNSSKAGRVTPRVSGTSYPSYLVYDNDINGTSETSPKKKKMQSELEDSFEEELTDNKTESDKIIKVTPPVEKLAKYTNLGKNIKIKNMMPSKTLNLPLLKGPISMTELPVEPTKIVKLHELKLGTTLTSKLTPKKREKNDSAKPKQKVSKTIPGSDSLSKAEVIFSQIKNPFQPNSTIEQEVKVINRPGPLNNIFRHIHQHMFHHFDENFAHGGMHHHEANHHEGGMHHEVGFHHGHGHHHGGHLYVDHSVEHWPWHMSIQEEHLHGWHHLCHGAMVGHHSVLTNAECVYHKPLPSLRVVRHNLIDKVITLDNSSFITARIIHPKYKDYVHHDHHHHVSHHNLALLHLHHDMGVRPIGYHHGHGHGHGHDHCSTAHHNSVQFITNEECDYHFGGEHIESSHVCAYGLPCDIHHHHGSPLVCSHHGHRPYLVGLSSYQHSCGHHHPTVYERIAPHTDWITSHIK